jgi:hypothetical protein
VPFLLGIPFFLPLHSSEPGFLTGFTGFPGFAFLNPAKIPVQTTKKRKDTPVPLLSIHFFY